jgi:hypothetical protein
VTSRSRRRTRSATAGCITPGDTFAYSIYSRAVQALRHPRRLDPVDAGLLRLLGKELKPYPPCEHPANTGQESHVMDAALSRLDQWVRDGVSPPYAPRITVAGGAKPAIERDGYGNALGGVRTPALDAPTATLTGGGNTGDSPQCELEGVTKTFGNARLAKLYPTHASYVAAVSQAVNRSVKAGFLVPADAPLIRDAAMKAPIPPSRP